MSVPHPLQEAARRLDGDVGSLRTRITQLEALVKARDKEVDRLNKMLGHASAAGVVCAGSCLCVHRACQCSRCGVCRLSLCVHRAC